MSAPLIGTPDMHIGVAVGLELAAELLRGRTTDDLVALTTDLERLARRVRFRVKDVEDALADDLEAELDKAASC